MDKISKIEEYYSELRSAARERAAENRAYARRDEIYRKIDNRLAAIECELAYAEIAKNEKEVKKLEKEKAQLSSKAEKALAALGMKMQDVEANYACKICNDTGFVGGKRCSCFQAALKATRQAIGIAPENMPEFGDDFARGALLEAAHEKMRSYCEKFPEVKFKNLVFLGKTGTGKTHLAKCVAHEIAKKGYDVIMLSSFQLNDIFIKYHSLFAADRSDGINAVMDCDLLVIDDLGAEQNFKNITTEYLLSVLSEREFRGAATIVTSNLGPDELLERYNERVYSRLVDKRASIVLNFTGDDMRLNK